MPPLPPRFKETKKRKITTPAAKKEKDASTAPTVTLNEDGSEVVIVADVSTEESGEIKTPKKRVYKPKTVAVTPSSDAEGEAGVDSDLTDGTTTPVKAVVKRVRKPAVKKATPVAAGIAAVEGCGESAVDTGVVTKVGDDSDVVPMDVDKQVSADLGDASGSDVVSQSDVAVITQSSVNAAAAIEEENAVETVITTPAKKAPRKKNNALKALESYNNTGGKEVMSEKRVSVQVDYTDSSLNVIDALLKSDDVFSKSPANKSSDIATNIVNAYFTADGSACSFDSIAPSVAGGHVTSSSVSSAVALEKVLSELPAEVVAKITANRDRMVVLLGELVALEGASDLCDRNLDLEQSMDDLVQYVTSVAAVSIATTSEETHVASVEGISSEEVCEELVATDAATPFSPNAVEGPPSSSSSAPETTPTHVVVTAPIVVATEPQSGEIDLLIRTVVTRSLQGVSLGTTAAAEHVNATLAVVVERINTACESITHINGSDVVNTVLGDIADLTVRAVVDRQQRVLAVIRGDSSDALLDVLLTRKLYGNPLCKSGLPQTECCELGAAWRWVTNYPTTYFTKSGQAVVREVSAVRTRYQKALGCLAKVVRDLSNESCSASALAVFEDRANKACLEVEKAKERRREVEAKRSAEAADKAQKEALKETKRREKEESDLKRKQLAAEKAEAAQAAKEAAALLKAGSASAEKEKKAHVPTEKELKAQRDLEKQKNALKGFFGSATKTSAGASTSSSTGTSVFNKPGHMSSSSSSAASLKPLRPIVFASSAPPVATSGSVVSSEMICVEGDGDILSITASATTASPMVLADEEVQVVPPAKSQALLDFEAQLQRGMSTSEIMQAYRSHSDGRVSRAKKHKPRGSVKLYVTVHLGSTNTNAFSGENDQTYSEIRERVVDKKMRTLSFAEDHRPAYVGTVTKRSRLISGRRPCVRDEELVNYDFDSEGEWEEEVEGEDIGDSGWQRTFSHSNIIFLPMSLFLSGDEMDSEDGDRNAVNELVYDDYFVRDNDYGSDAESDCDGDMRASAGMQSTGREREEVLGVRFISCAQRVSFPLSDAKTVSPGVVKSFRVESAMTDNTSSSTASPVSITYSACSDRDHDTHRLAQYSAVLFPTLVGGGINVAPFLGDLKHAAVTNSSGDITASGKKTKKRKTAESVDTSSATAIDSATVDASSVEGEEMDGKVAAVSKTFDESRLAELVRLVHGSKDGGDKLVAQFHAETAPHVPKTQIKKRLLEVAEKVRHVEGHGSQRWCVKGEVFTILGQASPVDLEFTPLKKKKARIEPTRVAPLETTTGCATVAGFISTFMPPELLVAPSAVSSSSSSSSSSALNDTPSTAVVPATPKKETKTVSVVTQSNKITAFVKTAAPVSLSSSSVVSVTSPSVSVVAPVIHTLIAKKKSPTKVSVTPNKTTNTTTTTNSGSEVKKVPEVIELL